MVSLSQDMWFETPGSAILKGHQISDSPPADFLMHPQGLFSGKVEGDLDSVPGYYGGTASYKWVQNARALTQHRLQRVKAAKARNEHLPFDFEFPPRHGLSPSDARIAAFQAAKARQAKKETRKTPARGQRYKSSDEFGARRYNQAADSKRANPQYEGFKNDFVGFRNEGRRYGNRGMSRLDHWVKHGNDWVYNKDAPGAAEANMLR